MGLYLWLKEQSLQDVQWAFLLMAKDTYVRDMLMDLLGGDAI
jgi:hypothetical protein